MYLANPKFVGESRWAGLDGHRLSNFETSSVGRRIQRTARSRNSWI